MFVCFCHFPSFPIWCPGSDVAFVWIPDLCLHPYFVFLRKAFYPNCLVLRITVLTLPKTVSLCRKALVSRLVLVSLLTSQGEYVSPPPPPPPARMDFAKHEVHANSLYSKKTKWKESVLKILLHIFQIQLQ